MYELCPILVFLAYFCYRVVLVCGDTRDCLEPQVITVWSAGLTHTHTAIPLGRVTGGWAH